MQHLRAAELPRRHGMDRPNIIYSSHNRPVSTASAKRLPRACRSKHSYPCPASPTAPRSRRLAERPDRHQLHLAAVSSTTNMTLGVLFEYDNDDLGTFGRSTAPTRPRASCSSTATSARRATASPAPTTSTSTTCCRRQVPLLEQIADIDGLRRGVLQYRREPPAPVLEHDVRRVDRPGTAELHPNVPPSIADPAFSNRTRSLILSLQNPVHPEQLGMMDTYSSVVSANLHLRNGVTGSVFLSKKADRDVASLGTNPVGREQLPAVRAADEIRLLHLLA